MTTSQTYRLTVELLPDRLQALWDEVERGSLTEADYETWKAALLEEHSNVWRASLLMGARADLEASLVAELAVYLGLDDAEVRRLCVEVPDQIEREWSAQVDVDRPESVERYYDLSASHLFELMSWHSLVDDLSPLAYVVALRFAQATGCQRALDFGAGVGSGGLLFARAGLEVTLGDISSVMLDFARWRFARRSLPVTVVDLKSERLPECAYDLITAMDVVEHLIDPVGTIEELHRALAPGGFLLGRFAVEADDERGEHVVRDFAPVFARLDELGMERVWEDEWLWGHQAFRKALT